MSRITDTEQLEFLLSCIRHSNCGKVDFEGVAKECSIVTKGAAAKRYERLTKCRNNASGGAASSTDSPAPSPKKVSHAGVGKKAAPSKKAAKKKMKAMEVQENYPGEESGEGAVRVSDDALFGQFCNTDGRNGEQVKEEDSDVEA
ncbi:hypothetical protein BDV29DRAFT_163269 [Aspergillus leporis]|uniref:Myb-like DNA-binding domain-containing protein n=1 Tax=Aspergillus leporis TaxID=41062 RepID=A0A5N5WJS0_9EURO|nr:hypothetical protein BDV29DRAFT_163269 [Aspergillus leporis]